MTRTVVRNLVCAFALLLPKPLKRAMLQRLLGWRIAPSADIGISLFVNVDDVQLGEGARIGHFNMFRNLHSVELGEKSLIGQWNWVSAATMFLRPGGEGERGCLLVGRQSAITSRHYLDCSGGIRVGAFTVVAGVRSTVLTHQVDIDAGRQTVRPVRIGDYCFVGSNARLTPGSVLVDRCVVAMGAVVVGKLNEPGMLYAGVPAKPIKAFGDAEFFKRVDGYVDS